MEPVITKEVEYVKKSDSEMDRITTVKTVTTETFSLASLRAIKAEKELRKSQDENLQTETNVRFATTLQSEQDEIDAAQASIDRAIELGLTE